ncbi:Cas1p-domain-containing protein, partial [Patellaria atrata CBS 101060]
VDSSDPQKCGALLEEGQWLDPQRSAYSPPDGYTIWQPPGCMVHNYSAEDVARCFGKRKVLFVGDSTVRQVFWAAAKKIDPSGYPKKRTLKENKELHSNMVYNTTDHHLEFLWDPYLNSSILHAELHAFRTAKEPQEGGTSEPTLSIPSSQNAASILIGGGLWQARYLDDRYFEQFKSAIDNILLTVSNYDQKTDIRFATLNGKEGLGDSIFFAPVQEPLYEELSPSRAATIKPGEISRMNEYLQELADKKRITLLSSYAAMIKGDPLTYGDSGLHVIDQISKERADALFNLRCNAKAAYNGGYPFSRTCCSAYPTINLVQLAVMAFGFVILPLSALTRYGRSKRTNRPSSNVTLNASIMLFVALCYCYFADRTAVFEKAHKRFIVSDFRSLAWGVLLLGLLTIRKIPSSGKAPISQSTQPDESFLPEAQTDEWKGWMQFFVLMYHYTGATEHLGLYIITRLLMASYVFLTAYQHSMYFLRQNDYSLRHVAGVLIRLNLSTVTISYMMRTDYMFYYLAPLLTYSFSVVYFTLRIGSSYNNKVLFVISKTLFSALLTWAFFAIPNLLELDLTFLKYTTRISWDPRSTRQNLTLDIFGPFIGLIVAILNTRISFILSPSNSYTDRLSQAIRTHFPFLRLALILLAATVFPVFYSLTSRSPDKADYNWWQPYIGILPVLAYAVVRNATLALRTLHSRAFAWLGRCALEAFVLSRHVWLAGDGRGLLSTGLFGSRDGRFWSDRWRDAVLLTPVFLWLAWRVRAATDVLAAWAV